jgi:hypothetical protein
VIYLGEQAQAFAEKIAKDVEEGLMGAKAEYCQAVDILRSLCTSARARRSSPTASATKAAEASHLPTSCIIKFEV